MKREDKQKIIEELKERFRRSKSVVLTDYKGLTVAEISELRKQLRASGVEYKVIKNTLAGIAVKGTDVESISTHLKGPIGVAFGYDDPTLAAKGVMDFATKNDKLKVGGGVIEGKYYDAKALKGISKLPGREVLLSILAGTLQAPASKMARLLAATIGRLGYGLAALKGKKSES